MDFGRINALLKIITMLLVVLLLAGPAHASTDVDYPSDCNDQSLDNLDEIGTPESATKTETYGHCPNTPYFTTYSPETHHIYQRVMHGRTVTVAFAKDFSLDQQGRETISQFIFDTWAIYWSEFMGFPYDSYTVAFGNNYQTCSAFGRGFDISDTYSPYLAHEIFHAWAGNAFRQADNITWFFEGLATYYGNMRQQNDMTFSTALVDIFYRQYLDIKASHGDVVVGNASLLDPDYNHQYVSTKGGLLCYMLDKKLNETGNNIGQVNRLIYQRFGLSQDSAYFSNDDILQALNDISGQDFSGFFAKYVYGTELIPQPANPRWICHTVANEP
ncbi:hypothetical protein AAU61_21380 [Desulfocarbo indianensis]|nr:hypothetical protein AAU61_21380 [Desulfocarbo indianensis]